MILSISILLISCGGEESSSGTQSASSSTAIPSVTNSWTQVGGVVAENTILKKAPSVVIHNSIPYIAIGRTIYVDPSDVSKGTRNVVEVKFFNGNDWQPLGGPLNHDLRNPAYSPSMAIHNNILYVSFDEYIYNDPANVSAGGYRSVYVKYFDLNSGSSWQLLGSEVNPSRNKTAKDSAIIIDNTNELVHIKYSFGTDIQYAVFHLGTSGGWISTLQTAIILLFSSPSLPTGAPDVLTTKVHPGYGQFFNDSVLVFQDNNDFYVSHDEYFYNDPNNVSAGGQRQTYVHKYDGASFIKLGDKLNSNAVSTIFNLELFFINNIVYALFEEHDGTKRSLILKKYP